MELSSESASGLVPQSVWKSNLLGTPSSFGAPSCVTCLRTPVVHQGGSPPQKVFVDKSFLLRAISWLPETPWTVSPASVHLTQTQHSCLTTSSSPGPHPKETRSQTGSLLGSAPIGPTPTMNAGCLPITLTMLPSDSLAG